MGRCTVNKRIVYTLRYRDGMRKVAFLRHARTHAHTHTPSHRPNHPHTYARTYPPPPTTHMHARRRLYVCRTRWVFVCLFVFVLFGGGGGGGLSFFFGNRGQGWGGGVQSEEGREDGGGVLR